MSQFDEADLQRRTKELDAREDALQKKEAIFKNKLDNTDLKALEESYRVREAQLQAIQDKINALTTTYAQKTFDIQKEERDWSSKISQLKAEKTDAEKELATVRSSIAVAEKTLRAIKQDIRDQQRYYKDQETTTQKAIADWNIQLQEFAQAVSDEHGRKTKLLDENRAIDEEIERSSNTLSELQDKINILEERFKERSAALRDDLALVSEKIKIKNVEAKKASDQLDFRKRNIDVAEEEIILKKRALDAKERELAIREQRLQARNSLL